MRIITLNANGIRAAANKGFFEWMHRQDADVVCIQETKAQHHQLRDRHFFPPGHHVYYHDAVRKGYSGVALYSRHQPDRVHYGAGWDAMDCEGRWLQADYGALSVITLYLPSGSSAANPCSGTSPKGLASAGGGGSGALSGAGSLVLTGSAPAPPPSTSTLSPSSRAGAGREDRPPCRWRASRVAIPPCPAPSPCRRQLPRGSFWRARSRRRAHRCRRPSPSCTNRP